MISNIFVLETSSVCTNTKITEGHLYLLVEFLVEFLTVFGDMFQLGPGSRGRHVARRQSQDRLHLETASSCRLQLNPEVVNLR